MFDRRDLQEMSRVGVALAREAGIAFEEWADHEAAVTLKMWVANVPQASEATAAMRGRSRTAGELELQRGIVTVNTGRRNGQPGRLWQRTKNGKYILAGMIGANGAINWSNRHFKESDWRRLLSNAEAYSELMPAAVAAGKKAVGLARQSVIQIADVLGLSLNVPGPGLSPDQIEKAREARSSDGKLYENGTGARERSEGKYAIELIDRYSRISQSGIDSALARVVENRLSFNRSELERVLASAANRVTKANPILEVK